MPTPAGTEWARFPKAPIKEAILDVRAALPLETTLEKLSSYHDLIRERYPQKRERVHFQAEFSTDKDAVQSKQVDGYLYTSADGKDIVQVRLDGFTVNRLQPYDRWQAFRDEAKKLWNDYVSIASPNFVSRIALRYINCLELPTPFKDFKEYILTTPEIAPSLPQGLKTFFMRLEIPHDEHEAIAIVTETMEPPTDDKVLPFIFDIDVIREAQFAPNSEEMWQMFERLRNFKNEIFFGSLTDEAKELFQ